MDEKGKSNIAKSKKENEFAAAFTKITTMSNVRAANAFIDPEYSVLFNNVRLLGEYIEKGELHKANEPLLKIAKRFEILKEIIKDAKKTNVQTLNTQRSKVDIESILKLSELLLAVTVLLKKYLKEKKQKESKIKATEIWNAIKSDTFKQLFTQLIGAWRIKTGNKYI